MGVRATGAAAFDLHVDVRIVHVVALLVNVIGPVMTQGDELFKQTIFHAFRMISSRKGGISLRGAVNGPRYSTERYGEVAYLDHAAIIDGDRLHVFALNRSLEEDMVLVVDCAERSMERVVDAEILHAGLKAENSFEAPDAVSAEPFDGWAVRGSAQATLPPHSFVATTFALTD